MTSLGSVTHILLQACEFPTQHRKVFPSLIMNRLVSPNCLKCPTFRAGRCSGTAKRLLATEESPLTRKDKQEGDISSVFSTFSGRKSAPLPDRFRDLKRNLTIGFEEEIQKSWDDLVETLKVRTEEVASKRESVRSSHLSNWEPYTKRSRSFLN